MTTRRRRHHDDDDTTTTTRRRRHADDDTPTTTRRRRHADDDTPTTTRRRRHADGDTPTTTRRRRHADERRPAGSCRRSDAEDLDTDDHFRCRKASIVRQTACPRRPWPRPSRDPAENEGLLNFSLDRIGEADRATPQVRVRRHAYGNPGRYERRRSPRGLSRRTRALWLRRRPTTRSTNRCLY
jgi:hypothetical protein